MFSTFRDSLKPFTPSRPPLLKIRSSTQSFFAPDRHVQLHDGPPREAVQPGFLARNKTERKRLQGLVRSRTMSVDADVVGKKGRSIVEGIKVWMVNDGQSACTPWSLVKSSHRRDGQDIPPLLDHAPCCWSRIGDPALSNERQPGRCSTDFRMDVRSVPGLVVWQILSSYT